MPATPSYPSRRHPHLSGYGYQTPGFYFVTICVEQRLRLFGSIEQGIMQLTPAGEMVRKTWHDLAVLHAGMAIDTEVSLPDHVHAIVVLEDDPARILSLADVVQRYKSLTTKRYAHGVRDQGWLRFAGRLWQQSFYDHVIRTDAELDRIRRYIMENAMRWELRQAAGQE
jgi:putative transposase